MIERKYTIGERRALNVIWNAAQDYSCEPLFLSIREDGSPDYYFNMVIGLAEKWLDRGRLRELFSSYEDSVRRETFDGILWLGLENWLFETEVRERPVLRSLRREEAAGFFASRTRGNLSRQEMMAKDMRVYTQTEARWADVLGRRRPSMTRREQELARALKIPGDVPPDRVIEVLRGVLADFFHVSETEQRGGSSRIPVSARMGRFLRHAMHREERRVDRLVIRQNYLRDKSGPDEDAGESRMRMDRHESIRTEEDRAYIEGCFGRCILSDGEMRILERDLCQGAHKDCFLWVAGSRPEGVRGESRPEGVQDTGSRTDTAPGAAGRPEEARSESTSRDAAEPPIPPDARKLREDAAQQAERNRAFARNAAVLVTSSIRTLSAQLETILASFARPLPERARAGRLDAGRAYRLDVVHDPYVFLRPGSDRERSLTVDILLDASASRTDSQEIIASQAYILARSLELCRVPVRVSAFRSLRGATALQILKDYDERGADGVFRYYAAGWNRDGLAIRLAERLMRQKKEGLDRILLVLTDASPNDGTGMPGARGFSHGYSGPDAVRDTADAVREIRASGIRTGAIYLGPTLYLENVHTIFGREFVRVQKVSQLAVGVTSLLTMMLRELKN
ncbi:MAG: hypothetical protein ACOYJJ_04555 [Anaerovoracaceae bacterium]|jgi:hypothetical protein